MFHVNFIELCSCELLDLNVMVPCDPVSELNLNYGDMKKWMTSRIFNYKINSLDRYKLINWTYSEWLHVYRFYHPNGTIDIEKTIQIMSNFRKFQNDPFKINPFPENITESDD